MNKETAFGGDSKVGVSFLEPWEHKTIAWLAPRVPGWISSVQLTLATLPISVGIILTGLLARSDIRWLWLSSLLILLQWLTDSLDGAVGRLRNTGLIRWGYYMDHFLDYVFLFSYLLSYALLYQEADRYLQFLVLAVYSAFMINSFLAFAATNEFRVSYFGFGATEARLIFIIVNTVVIVLSPTRVGLLLPLILLASLLGLLLVIYNTQRQLWLSDQRRKFAATRENK